MNASTFSVKITINASLPRVWDTLTKPDLIKEYLFGTNTESTWEVGAPIFFKGSFNGISYEDKGEILDIVHEKKLTYSYWSNLSGTPDLAQNYKTISFKLETHQNQVILTLTENNNKNENSESHWQSILTDLKKTAEKKN